MMWVLYLTFQNFEKLCCVIKLEKSIEAVILDWNNATLVLSFLRNASRDKLKCSSGPSPFKDGSGAGSPSFVL